jgi:hypothetical protein
MTRTEAIQLGAGAPCKRRANTLRPAVIHLVNEEKDRGRLLRFLASSGNGLACALERTPAPFLDRIASRTNVDKNIEAALIDVETECSAVVDRTVARQARAVIGRLREALRAFRIVGLPRLRGTRHDDGSFTVEWRFTDRRLAFTIEPNKAESGWHLVSSRSSGDIQACGGLSDGDLRPLLSWALRQMPRS